MCRLHEPVGLVPSVDSVEGSRAGEVDMLWRDTLVVGDATIVGCCLIGMP